jgi:hypothetical protein
MGQNQLRRQDKAYPADEGDPAPLLLNYLYLEFLEFDSYNLFKKINYWHMVI